MTDKEKHETIKRLIMWKNILKDVQKSEHISEYNIIRLMNTEHQKNVRKALENEVKQIIFETEVALKVADEN